MKNKLLIVLFTVWLGGMFFSSVLIPDQTISKEERRKLTQLPTITWQTIVKKIAMQEMDDYIVDQFPFRNQFRSLTAHIELDIFKKLDYHGIYKKKGYDF